jgi:hypothetical protein
LTLTTLTPITTADVTGATTLYFTPYLGDKIGLWDGTQWKIHTFTEKSLALGGYTASKPYDIFLYDNAGTLTLESAIWTNATTRASALSLVNGIYVKDAAPTRRYLGTIYINSSGGQTDDSLTKRFVWNYYNRIYRKLYRYTYDSHTYSTNAWRIWKAEAATSHQVEAVIGLTEGMIFMNLVGELKGDADGRLMAVGVGRDSTSTPYTSLSVRNANLQLIFAGQGASILETLGYHYYVALETAFSGLQGTINMYEINGGVFG